MSAVLDQGLLDEHIARLREGYRVKVAAMLAACDEHLAGLEGVSWVRPQGGLYVWLTLPEGLDAGPDGPLFQRAVDRGVLYVPGGYSFAGEGVPVAHATIRLSFGVQPPERIRQGIAALGEAIAEAVSAGWPAAAGSGRRA
jgi:2-aminoadipate transaminase